MTPCRTPVEIVLLDALVPGFDFRPVPMPGIPGVYELRAYGFVRKDGGGGPDLSSRIVPLNEREIISGDGIHLCPGQDAYLSVGFSMRIMEPGIVVRIVPHPDAAALGIGIVNGVGVVGPDYQGPVVIHVGNTKPPYINYDPGSVYEQAFYQLDPNVNAVTIPLGMPIARLYLAQVHEAEWLVR